MRPDTDFGKGTQTYNGFDITQQIRLKNGARVAGRPEHGQAEHRTRVTSSTRLGPCASVTARRRSCSTTHSRVRAVAVGHGDGRGLPGSAGPQITATRNYTNAEIAPSLGRNLSNGANGTVNVQLIEPGTMYGERQRQLDIRISKRVRFGRARLTGNWTFPTFSTARR